MKKFYSKLFLSFLFCLVYQVGIGQSDLQKSKYASLISDYLKTDKNDKMSEDDVKDLYINKEMTSEKTGVTNIYLNQRYNGVKIYNAISSVGIKDENIFHFANKFKKGIEENINTTSVSLTASEAINKAAQHFKLGSVNQLEIIEESPNNYLFSKGNISQEDIKVEKVYFEDKDGTLKLAWDLNIYTLDSNHWWSVRVDAVNGEILDIDDWVVGCNFYGDHSQHGVIKKEDNKKNNYKSINLFRSNALFAPDGSQYNVYALPTESPNHGPRTLVSSPADDLASPYGWHDDDGVDGAEWTATRGNNVQAYEDRGDTDVPVSLVDGTASLNFNFPLDFNDYPEDYENASVTNLFYMSNMMHDIFYHYGFDESSGNFQENNYGRGPAFGEGDIVNAEAQDGSGRNNANFATPPDGSNPRMQMYLYDLPGAINFTINEGLEAGNYSGVAAAFGPPLPSTPLNADLVVLVDDNAGSSTDENDACDAVTNAAALNGNIAIVTGSGCQFGSKVLAAQNAGAIAVIVVSGSGGPIRMGGGDDGDSVTIPSIMIDQTEGEAIMASRLDRFNDASLFFANSIDGSFDNGVIAHEYGHGISNRLTGGASASGCLTSCDETDPSGDCIKYTEQMGEGWSDWFTLMVTMKPTDVGTDGRGIGTFGQAQAIDGPGIRPRKYSTDFAVNSFTYGNTNSTSTLSAPHGVGFVWCTVLWDLTWAYIDKYGFDADLYGGDKGNNKVMQLVMDGLKLQPCNPGFVDGRNALLAADQALTGGENQCLIWGVFANRGLGFAADQGDSMSRTDQTEDFTIPNESQVTGAGLPSLASCTTLSSEDFNSSDYKVFPNPTNDNFTIRTTKNLGEVRLTLTDINGRTVLSKETTLFGDTEINMSTLQSGLYILNIKGEFISTNEKIIKN